MALNHSLVGNSGCPICGVLSSRTLPAHIAAFIRFRCDLRSEMEAQSYLCEACEYVFFAPLLTAEEIQKLHYNFRDLDYVSQRVQFEPDYAAIAEDHRNVEGAHFRARRQFYDDFRLDGFVTSGLVVDASDGDGYFARYACPFADVVTFPRVGSPPGADLERLLAQADLLMMAHSLQGSPDPVAALRRFSDGLKAGAAVWIETPVEYAGSLRAAFETLEARFARGLREYGPLNTLHENLSHFSARALRRLLERVGLRPLEFFRSSVGILAVMARVEGTASTVAAYG